MAKTPPSWKCTVCGYVHVGPEPPENCPRCGAERELFIPLSEPQPGFFKDLVTSMVPHSIAAHFPAGLIPAAALFLVWAVLSGDACLARAAMGMVAVATVVVPVSMATGLYDWRKHYQGVHASIFVKKIGLASLFLVLGILALFLFRSATGEGWRLWLGYVLVAAMVPVVVLLGHYGGKLAYHWRKREDKMGE